MKHNFVIVLTIFFLASCVNSSNLRRNNIHHGHIEDRPWTVTKTKVLKCPIGASLSGCSSDTYVKDMTTPLCRDLVLDETDIRVITSNMSYYYSVRATEVRVLSATYNLLPDKHYSMNTRYKCEGYFHQCVYVRGGQPC